MCYNIDQFQLKAWVVAADPLSFMANINLLLLLGLILLDVHQLNLHSNKIHVSFH